MVRTRYGHPLRFYIRLHCPQWPAVAQGALCPPAAAPPYGWRQHTLCQVADDELVAHVLMFLVSALSRRRWAPHAGLRRFAAAPGLLLGLVVIELVLVALHQIGMTAKIALADVVAVKGGYTFPDGGMDEGKIKKSLANPHGC